MKKISKIIFAAIFATALVVGADPVFAAKEKPAKEKAAKPAKAKKPKKGKFDEAGYREAVMNGDYDTAYGMLAGIPAEKQTTAQKMDIAMFMHHAGDYAGAAEQMKTAINDFDLVLGSEPLELFKIHAAKADYRGSLYEYMLIDAFDALNYYKLGDMDSAFSRVNRYLLEKQGIYMKKVGPVIEQEVSPKTEPALVDDATKGIVNAAFGLLGLDASSLIASMDTLVLPKKADVQNDTYRSSAFANWLWLVLGVQNDVDVLGNGLGDTVQKHLNITNKNIETVCLNIPKGKGRIEVLALAGSINQKQQDAMVADLTSTFAPIIGDDVAAAMVAFDKKISYNFYYPTYVATPEEKIIKVTKVSLSNGDSKEAVLLEDFDVAVMQDVNLKARRTAQRNVAADIGAKTPLFPVQIVAIPTLWAAVPPIPKMQEGFMNKVVGGLNNADPKADIRQAMALPSKAYCAGFTVDPGKYTVTVEYSNGKTTTEEVEVKPGKPVLVESLCK